MCETNLQLKYLLDVMDSIGSHIRKDLGRSGVESNSKTKLHNWSTDLEFFYVTKDLEFEETIKISNKKFKKTVIKSVTYVENPESLLDHIYEKRKLDKHKSTVRVGIDAGQGKIIMYKLTNKVYAHLNNLYRLLLS